jgi:hypothetical protein
MKTRIIEWAEPNPRNDPTLHIADRGARHSTVTGVTWLNNSLFVAAHRNGMKIAMFDVRESLPLIKSFGVPHLSDSVASKKIDENTWEIILSGCWECALTKYLLQINPKPEFKLIGIKKHIDKSFCHGVGYDSNSKPILSYHTGQDPRIESKNHTWRLPAPYGARHVCLHPDNGQLYAIAVSQNPKRLSYESTQTAIFAHDKLSNNFKLIYKLKNVHADACKIFKNRLWINDQKSDRVIGIHLEDKNSTIELKGKCFSFPHGLDVSNKGILAVTNYGSTSIALLDLAEL